MSYFDRPRGPYTLRVGTRYVTNAGARSFSLTAHLSRAERFTGVDAEGWARLIRERGYAADICDLRGEPTTVTYSKSFEDDPPTWAFDVGYARGGGGKCPA